MPPTHAYTTAQSGSTLYLKAVPGEIVFGVVVLCVVLLLLQHVALKKKPDES